MGNLSVSKEFLVALLDMYEGLPELREWRDVLRGAGMSANSRRWGGDLGQFVRSTEYSKLLTGSKLAAIHNDAAGRNHRVKHSPAHKLIAQT